MSHKIKRGLAAIALALGTVAVPVTAAQPAAATWGPGWNNLWVRAACTSYPMDNLTHFYVWAPNSPQGDKLFDPPDTGLGAYTAYHHYDNVYKRVNGNTYLNYRVHCKHSGVRSGQIAWGGSSSSTHWVTIRA